MEGEWGGDGGLQKRGRVVYFAVEPSVTNQCDQLCNFEKTDESCLCVFKVLGASVTIQCHIETSQSATVAVSSCCTFSLIHRSWVSSDKRHLVQSLVSGIQ